MQSFSQRTDSAFLRRKAGHLIRLRHVCDNVKIRSATIESCETQPHDATYKCLIPFSDIELSQTHFLETGACDFLRECCDLLVTRPGSAQTGFL